MALLTGRGERGRLGNVEEEREGHSSERERESGSRRRGTVYSTEDSVSVERVRLERHGAMRRGRGREKCEASLFRNMTDCLPPEVNQHL